MALLLGLAGVFAIMGFGGSSNATWARFEGGAIQPEVLDLLATMSFGGNSLAESAPSPVAAQSKLGDTDCDGEITSIDALFVLQFHAGLTPALPCPGAADVNEDGRVDSIDAALILQFDACPLIEPKFCR